MKINGLFALSSLLVLAAAQETTGSPTTTSLSAEASCAQNCGTNDRCCIAGCYKVPCPSKDQADDTNKCVAKCPQGTGTPEDTQAYISCQNACFTSHFFPATMTGVTVPTDVVSATATGDSTKTGSSGSSASETGSASESSSSDSSDSSESASASGSSTASGSGAAPTESNAGVPVKLGASAAGLFGVVMAALAL
ncbi:hypothetical protein PHISCL_09717 [Aspergillus sclerotialis]|uniref:GPI anchored serine-threonine rich protein n=1 Tax=Aspergillus sclerotialis TaxID=2070753 RepID=A0A3A2Z9J5_9EURO|nr:hypothetical protein PHISCL_09717 [Aspergillus sclerotialis]